MQGLSGPQEAGAWRFRQLAITFTAIVIVFAVLLASPLPPDIRRYISGSGLVAAGLAAAASFFRRSRQTTGRRRRSWILFTVVATLAATSNLFVLLFGSTTALATPTLLLGLVAGVVGIIFFPQARRRSTDLGRIVLDGIVLGGSVLFISSVSVFPHILDGRGSTPTDLLVPIIDVAIATVATLLFLRGASADRPVLGLLAAGFIAITASDFSYAIRLSETGSFDFGNFSDIGWICGWGLIALSILVPSSTAYPSGEGVKDASPVLGTVVLFLLFLFAAVLSLVHVRKGPLPVSSATLWLVVLLAVMARQVLLIADNETLRRTLERRVVERSRSLRQVTQQSDLVVDSVGDGIYLVDRNGMITYVNPAASRILGFPQTALVGRDAHSMFHAPAPDGAPYPSDNCYITEAIRDLVAASAEDDNYVRADGALVPVEVTATPLIDDDQAIGAVVVFRDVTQRREVDRIKNEFISMVSHELRTPLTAIRGSLGLIAGGAFGQVTPAASRMVDIALISSERLTRLINQILDIERIESGVVSMDLVDCTAATLVESAVRQVDVLAADAEVTVRAGRISGNVHTDTDRVVQTLLNLIGNAIKFSDPGGRVLVSCEPNGAMVEFTIADTGRGIPEDKLDTIFNRFEQVDSSDAREKGGSGLGLAISKSIVERLGGHIWAANNAEGGATFRFTLPAAESTWQPPTDNGTTNGHAAADLVLGAGHDRGAVGSVPADSTASEGR